MNKDTVEGDWKQLSGAIKAKWGKLTDDDLTHARGDGEYLVGKLQEQYGLTKDKAKESLRELGYQARDAKRRAAAARDADEDEPTQRADPR